MIRETRVLSGPENMAIDYALLREAARRGVAFLRLYGWNPACLSFGRNEAALRRYDRERIAALGLNTVRRPTGGRAVWHDREVTYCVAAPAAAFGSLRKTYILVHDTLAQALRSIGIDASLAGARRRVPRPDAGACFASPVGGEVIVGDRKLIGSAQLREGTSFLQHGSILLEDGQDMVERISIRPIPLSSTSVASVSGREVTAGELEESVVTAFEARFETRMTGCAPPPVSDSPIDFASRSWTWRK